MSTDSTPELRAINDRLHRMEDSMEELNSRIARLAIALGVSLKTDHDVQQVMSRKSFQQEAPPQAVPRVSDRRSGASSAFKGLDRRSGTDRRLAYKWEELRGLLVLRYGVEKNYVQQLGLDATREIMTTAEQHMQRDGFRPGADGVDLDTFRS